MQTSSDKRKVSANICVRGKTKTLKCCVSNIQTLTDLHEDLHENHCLFNIHIWISSQRTVCP